MAKSKQPVNKKTVSSVKKPMPFYPFWMFPAIVVFILALYGNTFQHKYALDDFVYFTNHAAVQKGVKGIPAIFQKGSMTDCDGRTGEQPYRPLTLASFAIDKSIANSNPSFSHFINVLLYILLGIILLKWLRTLFPGNAAWVNFLIVLVFIAHPVHTEVIANIKSRDELLAAILGLLAWRISFSDEKSKNNVRNITISSILFFMALLSKENAITLIPLVILSFILLKKDSILKALNKSWQFIAIGLVYLAIRQTIVGGPSSYAASLTAIDNILCSTQNIFELIATKAEILIYYLKLLLIPYPLSWDYSFNQIPVVSITSFIAIASILIHLSLLILSILFIKRKPEWSFWILFYFISFSLTNNLFIIIGATLSERFLFIPSIAFAAILIKLLTGLFINKNEKIAKQRVVYSVVPLIFIYSILTINRNKDWKDDFTLMQTGIASSPNSARTHFVMGSEYAKKAAKASTSFERQELFDKSIEQFNISLKILPSYTDASYNLGITYSTMGDTAKAISAYQYSLQQDPHHKGTLHNIGLIYSERGDFDSSLKYILVLDKFYPGDVGTLNMLTAAYYFKHDYQTAYDYALSALKILPNDPNANKNMAGVLQAMGRFEEAAEYLKKAQ